MMLRRYHDKKEVVEEAKAPVKEAEVVEVVKAVEETTTEQKKQNRKSTTK